MVSPSAREARGVSARGLRDAVLVERISAIHRDNYGIYGVRKMWHALHRHIFRQDAVLYKTDAEKSHVRAHGED